MAVAPEVPGTDRGVTMYFPPDVGGANCFVQARQIHAMNTIEVRAVGFGKGGDRYCLELIDESRIAGMSYEQIALELTIAAAHCVRKLTA